VSIAPQNPARLYRISLMWLSITGLTTTRRDMMKGMENTAVLEPSQPVSRKAAKMTILGAFADLREFAILFCFH
jgi:hypothetical protein